MARGLGSPADPGPAARGAADIDWPKPSGLDCGLAQLEPANSAPPCRTALAEDALLLEEILDEREGRRDDGGLDFPNLGGE